MRQLVRDLFCNIDNQHWELARFMSAGSFASYTAAFLHSSFWLHKDIDWSALGVGYAALLGGAGAMIGLKDLARAKASGASVDTERG